MPWRESIEHQHKQRQNDLLWRQRRTLESAQGREVLIGGKTLLNFSSNDYLGLANHPALRAAAIEATQKWGTGSGASHLVCGHQLPHEKLEMQLAKFLGSEAAIVFSTGYMANLAVPQTFLSRHDLLLEDRLNHASLLDAGALCPAKMKRYPHRDVSAVTRLLDAADQPRKMVLTDGTFSMDGDCAPVSELSQACRQHSAMLVVDDAHGLGVLGESGGGLLQQANVAIAGNVLMVGTLGKAAGSFGAFVAGDRVYIESLLQFARPYIYTTALPPSVAAASLKAIELFETEAWRRERLRDLISEFRQRAAALNLAVLDSETAIQPIVLGDEQAAMTASQILNDNGILAIAIRPPTVPAGSSRIRFTLTAEHTEQDLESLFTVLKSDPLRRLLEVDG